MSSTDETAMMGMYDQRTGRRRDIGIIGTAARVTVGLVLVGSVVYGQLSSHLTLAAWALGLVGFPVLALVWRRWRIHRDLTPFYYTKWVDSEAWWRGGRPALSRPLATLPHRGRARAREVAAGDVSAAAGSGSPPPVGEGLGMGPRGTRKTSVATYLAH